MCLPTQAEDFSVDIVRGAKGTVPEYAAPAKDSVSDDLSNIGEPLCHSTPINTCRDVTSNNDVNFPRDMVKTILAHSELTSGKNARETTVQYDFAKSVFQVKNMWQTKQL